MLVAESKDLSFLWLPKALTWEESLSFISLWSKVVMQTNCAVASPQLGCVSNLPADSKTSSNGKRRFSDNIDFAVKEHGIVARRCKFVIPREKPRAFPLAVGLSESQTKGKRGWYDDAKRSWQQQRRLLDVRNINRNGTVHWLQVQLEGGPWQFKTYSIRPSSSSAIRVGSWIRHLLFDSNNLLAASPDAHSVECPVAIYPRIEHGPKKSRMSDLVMRQTGWKETGDPSFYADKMPYNIHAPFCPAILFLPFACLVSDNTWTLIYWFCHRFLPLPSIGSQ